VSSSSSVSSLSTTTSSGGSGGSTFADGGVTCTDAVDALCCAKDKLRPLPTSAASVLDLSMPEAIPQGTCSMYHQGQTLTTSLALSHDPADYPMKIILPALSGPDPACLDVCSGNVEAITTFGVAIRTGAPDEGYLIGGDTGRVLAISVPPPWYFVSGGCGEACAWPCLDGYQEFGVRSCITMGHGDFGFATADPNAPSVEAVLELIDLGGQQAFEVAPYGCCLFE
jgi:hypothetical protein